jgi:hypothetical protein
MPPVKSGRARRTRTADRSHRRPRPANKYQVSGVPHTVIGDSPQPMIGAYPEAAAAEMLVAAARGLKGM